jgi:hypothetical protein
MTLSEKILSEKQRTDLELFYKNADKILYPYFKSNGYKKYMNRGHYSIIFQKSDAAKFLALQYLSLVPYGINGFDVNISGKSMMTSLKN